MKEFLREIPPLVWLAVCFAAAWCRQKIRERRRSARGSIGIRLRSPTVCQEIADNERIAWRVNLRTGAYRRIG